MTHLYCPVIAAVLGLSGEALSPDDGVSLALAWKHVSGEVTGSLAQARANGQETAKISLNSLQFAGWLKPLPATVCDTMVRLLAVNYGLEARVAGEAGSLHLAIPMAQFMPGYIAPSLTEGAA